MIAKRQQTGTHGVFLAAAELTARGFIAVLTSRNAFGDLLVTDQGCLKTFSVQVKTNAGRGNFWLLNKHSKRLKSPSHIYVFVNLCEGRDPPKTEYYVVPSRIVAKNMCVQRRPGSTWYSFDRSYAAQYKDKWSILGARS